MERLVIDFNKWGSNSLLNERTGKMCCLGFKCIADGLRPKDIVGFAYPPTKVAGIPKKLLHEYSHKRLSQEKEAIAANFNDRIHHQISLGNTKGAKTTLKHLRRVFKNANIILTIRNLPRSMK